MEIFKKYNDVLSKISDQRFNQFIKEAFEEAGYTATGCLLKAPDKKLCEVISSHTMRRSFCTNLYNEGVPPVVIMKISGHKTETAFLKYLKVTQTDAADKLSAHYKKMKQSNLTMETKTFEQRLQENQQKLLSLLSMISKTGLKSAEYKALSKEANQEYRALRKEAKELNKGRRLPSLAEMMNKQLRIK